MFNDDEIILCYRIVSFYLNMSENGLLHGQVEERSQFDRNWTFGEKKTFKQNTICIFVNCVQQTQMLAKYVGSVYI